MASPRNIRYNPYNGRLIISGQPAFTISGPLAGRRSMQKGGRKILPQQETIITLPPGFELAVVRAEAVTVRGQSPVTVRA